MRLHSLVRVRQLLLGTAVALLLSGAAVAADFACFKSAGLKPPLRLQFTFDGEPEDLGYVAYQNGSGRIPVKRGSERELRQGPKGRPSETETRWDEVSADGSGGTYVVVSQGARIYDFRYLRKKDGKVFKFEEDLDAAGDNGCNWK